MPDPKNPTPANPDVLRAVLRDECGLPLGFVPSPSGWPPPELPLTRGDLEAIVRRVVREELERFDTFRELKRRARALMEAFDLRLGGRR